MNQWLEAKEREADWRRRQELRAQDIYIKHLQQQALCHWAQGTKMWRMERLTEERVVEKWGEVRRWLGT